jgi:hypothetical protein
MELDELILCTFTIGNILSGISLCTCKPHFLKNLLQIRSSASKATWELETITRNHNRPIIENQRKCLLADIFKMMLSLSYLST